MLYEKPTFLYIQGGRRVYSKPVRKNFKHWKPYVRPIENGYMCVMTFGQLRVHGYGKTIEFAYWAMFQNEKMVRELIQDMIELDEIKENKRWWEFWK